MAEKIGLFDKTKIFLGEVRTEMSKVVWPTEQETRSYTIIVIISTTAIALVMGAWDFVLGKAVNFIFGLGG